MRIGSLFSGAGGLDLALAELFPAAVTAWHAETDPAAARVLAHHWPGVPNLGDVSTVDWAAAAPVDVIAGGFPCQDVSAAGLKTGLGEGTRSGLWSHMRDAIQILRPRWVFIENVRGLLNARAIRPVESGTDPVGDRDSGSVLRAAGAVLGDLAGIGYDAGWVCLRAAAVGACHGRDRVFILAHPADAARDGLESFHDGAGGAAACGGRKWVTGRGTGRGAGPVALLPTPNASDSTGGGVHPDRRIGHSQQLIDWVLLYGSPRWEAYRPAIARQESLSRPAPCPVELGGRGKPRLAAAFSEWMMGWPPGWVTDPGIGLAYKDQLRIAGNGVVPAQAVTAFRHLRTVCEVAG